jgi:hypothetical protein
MPLCTLHTKHEYTHALLQSQHSPPHSVEDANHCRKLEEYHHIIDRAQDLKYSEQIIAPG